MTGPATTLNQQPLVSVVTPVYNGEKHLRECIDSVLDQTYTNWDFTIVDNCSTDRTSEIAREYAAGDTRIRVLRNTTFVRAIENYNIAFRQIAPASKYCKVLAADDTLLPECLERMVRVGEEHPSAAIVGAYSVRGTGIAFEGPPYPNTIVRGRDICRMKFLDGLYVFGTPSTLLFRSSIVRSRHAFFNESNLHADSEACIEFLEHDDFGFVHQILTFSRPADSGSLTWRSEQINTYLPAHLGELVKYGSKYLSGEELERAIKETLRAYYAWLGKEAFKFRKRQFWRFHQSKLAELGYPLKGFRLAVAMTAFGADLLLNPKRTLERALRREASSTGERSIRRHRRVPRASPPGAETVRSVDVAVDHSVRQ